MAKKQKPDNPAMRGLYGAVARRGKPKADFSDVRGGSSSSAPYRPARPKLPKPIPTATAGIESIGAAMKRIRGGRD